MYRDKSISVVIPCHNEEAGIRLLLPQMPGVVDEVVVVDNGSTDTTAKVARMMGARVIPEPCKGYGRAYKTGFHEARGNIVVTMDGDGTYPPDCIPLLLHVLFEQELDFITARRCYSRNGRTKSPIRLLGNAILSASILVLFHKLIVDSQSGMWVFRRDILEHIRLTSDGMAFSEEIKVEAFIHKGIRALETPIYYGERVGKSKLNLWRDGFSNLFFLFRKRLGLWLSRYESAPVEEQAKVEKVRTAAGDP